MNVSTFGLSINLEALRNLSVKKLRDMNAFLCLKSASHLSFSKLHIACYPVCLRCRDFASKALYWGYFEGVGRRPPIYKKLDTINSLLHHKKNMLGEVQISDSLLLSLHNERTKLRVSAVEPK